MSDQLLKIKQDLNWVGTHEEFFDEDSPQFVQDVVENIVEVVEEVKPKMNAFMDKFGVFADLNDDGVVDIADWKKGVKYFALLYSGLLSMMYVILGNDMDELMANVYFAITFGIIAFIVTIVAVMASKKLNKKDKLIKTMKQKNLEQGALLYQQEMDMEVLTHNHILNIQEKDFQIRIKDGLYNAEKDKQQ